MNIEEKYKMLSCRIADMTNNTTFFRFKIVDELNSAGYVKTYYTTPNMFKEDIWFLSHQCKTYKDTIEWLIGFTWINKFLRDNMSPEEMDLKLTIRGY